MTALVLDASPRVVALTIKPGNGATAAALKPLPPCNSLARRAKKRKGSEKHNNTAVCRGT